MRTRIFPLPGSGEPSLQGRRDFRKPLSGQRQFHPFEQPVRVRIARSERQKPRASNEAFVCPFRRVAPGNALGDVLLNEPSTAAVNFKVDDGGTFVVFASDYAGIEFVSGATLTLVATFSDGTAATVMMRIP